VKNIVAILGSPRRWGNTEILLDEFLKEFKGGSFRIKKFVAAEMRISPCNNCCRCLKTGKCVFKDDMTELYKEMERADCLILASPIYFTNMPGALKILIDRCQVFWARTYVLKKQLKPDNKRYGVFLSVCGFSSASMFNCANRMAKVLFRVLGIGTFKKIAIPGVDKKGDILKRPEALLKARRLAKRTIKEL
jgi:multimeric flavodoxin WrbA